MAGPNSNVTSITTAMDPVVMLSLRHTARAEPEKTVVRTPTGCRVAVRDVQQRESGERTVHVVTADPSAAACRSAGVLDLGPRAPHHFPEGPALRWGALEVRWRKAQYRCREPRCSRKAFTESIAELPSGTRVTGRLPVRDRGGG